jgi:hypothetical protein
MFAGIGEILVSLPMFDRIEWSFASALIGEDIIFIFV